jgi:peptidoglycan/xylan/chitin deacetylase (PgdA/CDA1 family)
MKILFTLDYELFLGVRTGTVRKCLIEPMDAYLQATEEAGVRFTLFVDAAFLLRLKELAPSFPALEEEYRGIRDALCLLKEKGHDIQLHIHPQWMYSTFDGTGWRMDAGHYKLSDLGADEASALFGRCRELLESVSGNPVIAYRAGGFSVPAGIAALFSPHGIKVDSSVCPGTCYFSGCQDYDYRNIDLRSAYRFDKDMSCPTGMGTYVELPVYTYRTSPIFWYRYVISRLLKSKRHRLLGDGVSVEATTGSIIERLTRRTWGLATTDGFKINYLYDAYRYACRTGEETFCVIGHPKLATPYSLKKLRDFCSRIAGDGNEFMTVSGFYTSLKGTGTIA